MAKTLQELHAGLAALRMKHRNAFVAPRAGAAQPLPGEERRTGTGAHWIMSKTYSEHGGMPTAALVDLPANLLDGITQGAIPQVAPERIAFLDTETTGLSGGTGTVAFVIGLGQITPQGFTVKQYFMRDFHEEASQLEALADDLRDFDVLCTYNGRTFDQPLLESRYIMNRQRPPFARLEHLDLLYGARRLWKLKFESCRLVELETRILGHERVGDVPGHQIPALYFQWLHTQRGAPLEPVFEHNRLDIVSLACLTAIVPRAFQEPYGMGRAAGHEMIGLGRWLAAADRLPDAVELWKRAVETHIPDELLFRTLWDIALAEKKLGRPPDAFLDLIESRNPYRAAALEELAKHYEHKQKDPVKALEYARRALEFAGDAKLQQREQRLERKAKRAAASLLD